MLGPGGGQSRPLVLHVLKSQPFTTQIQGPANQQGGLGLARPSLETGVHSQSHHLSAKGLATQGAEQPRRRDGPGGQAHHTASLPRQRRRARNQTNREGVARDTAAVNTGARAGDPRSAQTMSHARTRPLTQKLHFRCHALQTPLGLSRKGAHVTLPRSGHAHGTGCVRPTTGPKDRSAPPASARASTGAKLCHVSKQSMKTQKNQAPPRPPCGATGARAPRARAAVSEQLRCGLSTACRAGATRPPHPS